MKDTRTAAGIKAGCEERNLDPRHAFGLMCEYAEALERKLAQFESKSCTSVSESVLVGGNHLATVLIGWLGPDFAYRFTPYMDADAAREKIIQAAGTNAYDVWCCWRAIMLARDVHKPRSDSK